MNRYITISLVGLGLAAPAAFLSPPVALALGFLTTAFARTIAHRTLLESSPAASGSARDQEHQGAARSSDGV